MVLDSSALIAIFLEEPGHERIAHKIDNASVLMVSAPTVLETTIVLHRHMAEVATRRVEAYLAAVGAEIVPFSEAHYSSAISAFLRFGKGRHPARLNFGDCIAYATADLAGLPLLYVGDDFSKTDIEAA